MPKLEVLQDLDLYYVRQLASSLKVIFFLLLLLNFLGLNAKINQSLHAIAPISISNRERFSVAVSVCLHLEQDVRQDVLG